MQLQIGCLQQKSWLCVTGVCSVLDVLRCMQLQQQSVVVDTAIERLLNCNLSSKYAFTGRLCVSQFALMFLFIPSSDLFSAYFHDVQNMQNIKIFLLIKVA